MCVNFGKGITVVALKTASLEHEAAVLIYGVTLCALYARDRRVLMKRLKSGWRVRPGKEMRFLPTARPRQNHRVRSGRNL